jgi:DNA-binding protein H-NS
MDLSKLSIAELRKLQDDIKVQLKKRELADVANARDQIQSIAQRVGISLKELVATGTRTKTGAVAARYRNPTNASQQWSGRGRQPKWVKEWIGAGKSIDDLRI